MTTAWDRRHHQAAANARTRAAELADRHTRPATPSPADAARTTTPELRQCPRCFGPTETPEEHCT